MYGTAVEMMRRSCQAPVSPWSASPSHHNAYQGDEEHGDIVGHHQGDEFETGRVNDTLRLLSVCEACHGLRSLLRWRWGCPLLVLVNGIKELWMAKMKKIMDDNKPRQSHSQDKDIQGRTWR